MSFCIKINSFDLNRKILPCYKRKQEKNPEKNRGYGIRENMSQKCYLLKKNCAFTIFFDIYKV